MAIPREEQLAGKRAQSKFAKEADPEKIRKQGREASRRYIAKNRDAMREKAREYRLKHPEKVAASHEKYTSGNPEKVKAASFKHLLCRYGLTPEQYHELLRIQDDQCPICSADLNNKVSHVDHDHDTGLVRGIVCHHCNVGMGQFGDSADLLRKAADFLDSCHEKPITQCA